MREQGIDVIAHSQGDAGQLIIDDDMDFARYLLAGFAAVVVPAAALWSRPAFACS
ncbi:hypothetical protein [Xaviernesmea oryzae]|uniref:hypothetical protein n=1 Tax=Xaviernesmea oryzae TaxID=464029 RepID=UPI001479BDA2|nr:hypothetical protein [Xaviernesmea oryzae]